MKVLVVTATYPPMPSGGADYAFRLCEYLSQDGVEVHVLTGKQASANEIPAVKVYPIMNTWAWLELFEIVQTAKRVKPDVINLHFGGFLYNDHPMITFLPTIIKWLLPNCRFVTLIEAPIGVKAYLCSFPVRAIHKLMVLFTDNIDYSYGTLLHDSDALIVLSGVHSAFLATLNESVTRKSVLIPPPPLMRMSPPDDANLRMITRQSLKIGADEFLIAYCGYLYPGKGVETLLEAFKRAADKRNDVRLILIGGTPSMLLDSLKSPDYGSQLKKLCDDLGVGDRVIWTGGYETDSEVPSKYLRASDLCVLPFDRGVFLNNSSFGSCAAHGLPIITTRGETLESPFVDQENILLCPPKNSVLLSEAILRLVDDRQLRGKLAKNSYELAQRVFSWPHAVKETLAVFRGEAPTSLL